MRHLQPKKFIALNKKKGGTNNPPPTTFSVGKVIPWPVAPQQSRPPFHFTV